MKFHGDSFLISALKNGQVLIWNHLRSTLSKKIENSIAVTSILSFQKKYVCFASDDGKLRAVDMDEGKEVKIFRLPEKSTSIALSTHENLIYESTANGNIAVWNL
jgi:WD40 repeat protein